MSISANSEKVAAFKKNVNYQHKYLIYYTRFPQSSVHGKHTNTEIYTCVYMFSVILFSLILTNAFELEFRRLGKHAGVSRQDLEAKTPKLCKNSWSSWSSSSSWSSCMCLEICLMSVRPLTVSKQKKKRELQQQQMRTTGENSRDKLAICFILWFFILSYFDDFLFLFSTSFFSNFFPFYIMFCVHIFSCMRLY